ncbi:hypothetical protein S7711_01837 [Stachybotrys chartarum IBT 7711]|uniref:Glucose-methanol-choline oxidoreductase N-terminal domain-containing protein n=1 Tax=Stachybotrys chartarum (strain CBS 109288 / IBT 7711) TaxID=1280523 RepID=A0A084AJ47_STACB|nr:hypothetical protein S7711_01837 [Stachybotrys chartarum IBT 7711]KFA47492.1 hypothetical protein S40293_02157 [Stachybotrys chartarum IBT 40293]
MLLQKIPVLSLLAVAGPLAVAWPKPPMHAHILQRQVEVQDEYDYVIIGGGTSGLTVDTVLVIEIGQYHNASGMHPSRMFDITSEPNPELNGRSFAVGIGRAVGGSSIVNGQVMQRGTKPEYDAWQELGGPGSDWDWDGLLPYFRKGITLSPPDEEVAAEFNVSYNPEYWGTETPIYAAFGGGRPAEVTSMSLPVNQILFDDELAATGVQFISVNETAPEPRVVRARREVILAAGTIHTPQVLQLSGIGPSAALEDVGIDVKVDLPGVGSNFQDHSYIPWIGYQWGRPPGGAPGNGMVGSPNLLAQVGLPVLSPDNYESLTARYEEQDPLSHLPESYTPEQVEGYRQQQAVYARLLRAPDTTVNSMMMTGPGGSIQNLHPLSRGIVSLNPEDPEGEVTVDYRAATNELDLEVMAENILFMRRYMQAEAFEPYSPREILPGASVSTRQQLVNWVKGQIIPSVYHPVGTAAKVPREQGGVVDEQLLVYGTSRLSIIDASIMPTLVGATTQMTVYAVAEKAADLIKARTFD